jgi:hypothetical protein
MKRILVVITMLLACQAHAFSQAGEDITDLWWNPAESGWGMNVIQQGDTSFVTMFVYGADNQPTWFSASSLKYVRFDAATDEFIHEGELFRTTGPAYSAATFDPNAVTVRRVGYLQFRLTLSTARNTLYLGRVIYTVDNVEVTKPNLERASLRRTDHSGIYAGAFRFTTSNCSSSSLNGEYVLFGSTTVTQSAADVLAIDVVRDGGTYACRYSGRYYQAGRNGVIPSGSFSCNDGAGGTFAATDIAGGLTGMSATLYAVYSSGGCQESVRFSAAK